MSNPIQKTNVSALAKLSNLNFTKNQTDNLDSQLEQILSHVKQINRLPIKHLTATNQVTGKSNELRQDTITPSLSQKQALTSAKRTYKGYFVVPAVFHDQ